MRFRITLALVAVLMLGTTGIASAQEYETGTLEVVHDIPEAPAVGLSVTPFGTEEPVDLGVLEPGDTLTADLPAGEHLLTVTNAEDDSVLLEGVPFEILAGETTTIVASEALAEEEAGGLAFIHDVLDGPTVRLVVTPFGTEEPIDFAEVAPGEEVLPTLLPAGDHLLALENVEDDSVLAEGFAFTITNEAVTTLRASEVLGVDDDDDDADDDDADDDDDNGIKVPDVVRTGAGGSADGAPVAGLVLLAALGLTAGGAAVARRRAA